MAFLGRISGWLIGNVHKFSSSNMKQAAKGPVAMIILLVLKIELLEAQLVSVKLRRPEETKTSIRHSGAIAGGPRGYTTSLSRV